MANCYMKASYLQPPSIPANDIIEMQKALSSHLAFSNFIDKCLKAANVIKILREKLFEESGLKEWYDSSIQKIEKEYKENIEQFYFIRKPKSEMEKWANGELKNKEIDGKFNLWKDLKPNELLNQEFVNKNKENYDNWVNEAEGLEEIKKEEDDTKRDKMLYQKYVDELSEEYNAWIENHDSTKELKKIYVNDMNSRFLKWVRRLAPMSLFLNSGYRSFAEILIKKLVKASENQAESKEFSTILKAMLERMKIEIHTNTNIAKYTFLRHYTNVDEFEKAYKILKDEVEKVEIEVETARKDYNPDDIPKFPKVKRVIWIVRHGQRLDNDKQIRDEAKASQNKRFNVRKCGNKCEKECNKEECIRFELDNSPLNQNGEERAVVLDKVFKNINIHHIFSSPYERAIQTAEILLGDSHKNYDPKGELLNELKIKVEPGFMESMVDCIGKENIGYEEFDKLVEHHTLLDDKYEPIFNKKKLIKYRKGEERKSNIACTERVKDFFKKFIKNLGSENLKKSKFTKKDLENEQSEWLQPGEEKAEQIVIVAHGLILNAIQNQIAGMFAIAPQVGIYKNLSLIRKYFRLRLLKLSK
uniref:Uncharacterized protein n=1 Tax=Meloidogyne hapla TaxID=6305 RepID=A0A1I8BVS5_MELHA